MVQPSVERPAIGEAGERIGKRLGLAGPHDRMQEARDDQQAGGNRQQAAARLRDGGVDRARIVPFRRARSQPDGERRLEREMQGHDDGYTDETAIEQGRGRVPLHRHRAKDRPKCEPALEGELIPNRIARRLDRRDPPQAAANQDQRGARPHRSALVIMRHGQRHRDQRGEKRREPDGLQDRDVPAEPDGEARSRRTQRQERTSARA